MSRTTSTRRRRRGTTDYIVLDRRDCAACRSCVDACPNGVLRVIAIGPHRHAKIAHPDACTGCLACVRACETGALQRRSG